MEKSAVVLFLGSLKAVVDIVLTCTCIVQPVSLIV